MAVVLKRKALDIWYECPCGYAWEERYECACDSECPVCFKTIEASEWEGAEWDDLEVIATLGGVAVGECDDRHNVSS